MHADVDFRSVLGRRKLLPGAFRANEKLREANLPRERSGKRILA
jgi:hypothetical protein